ncbi:beta-lactamase [Alkalispirochaeta odontotermitis]|nr:beta-lactamase [Alkalispirochaeta odontotermitis]CAB1078587.1 Ribonuclease Z (EC [Olavius algarvensis Delta 1 endosymbiont]
MVSVKFLGCGDNFGSGGRFQTCISVQSEAANFLIDCGASALISMKKFGVSLLDIETILITHLHGDHFAGIPFFILDSQLISRRTAPLVIAGPPGLQDRIYRAMEVMYPGSSKVKQKFEISYLELPESLPTTIGALSVTAEQVIHGSGAPSYALRVACAGKTIAYTGDTEWTDNLIKIASGVDLFIAETYFYEKKMKNHLNYRTLLQQRQALDCKRIIITHMSDDMLERLDSVELEYAEDGKELQV